MVRQEVSVLFGGTGVWCLVCHHEIQFSELSVILMLTVIDLQFSACKSYYFVVVVCVFQLVTPKLLGHLELCSYTLAWWMHPIPV